MKKLLAIFSLAIFIFSGVYADAQVVYPNRGGSGTTTITGILQGNGTSPYTAIADGAANSVLSTDGAGTYSFQPIGVAWGSITGTITDQTDLTTYVTGLPISTFTNDSGFISPSGATLAAISAYSTITSESLYTMTSSVPVEFRTSGGSTLAYLDESNARFGVGLNSLSLGKFESRATSGSQAVFSYSGSLYAHIDVGSTGATVFQTNAGTAATVATDTGLGDMTVKSGTLTVQGTDNFDGASLDAYAPYTSMSEGFSGVGLLQGGAISLNDATDWTSATAGSFSVVGGTLEDVTSGSFALGASINALGGSFDGANYVGGDASIYAGNGTDTNGSIYFGSIDENGDATNWGAFVAGKFGVGNISPSAFIHSLGTTEQLRLGYDTSNYFSTTVASTGKTNFGISGTNKIYLDTIGPDIMVGGTFDSGTGWSLQSGWTISGGLLVGNTVTSAREASIFVPAMVTGNIYEVTYTISGYVSGAVRVNVDGNTYGTSRTADGTYTENLTAAGAAGRVYLITHTGGFVGNIDNVIVKLVGTVKGTTNTTGTNAVGTHTIYTGSAGTGTGTPGDHIFYGSYTGSSGSTQQNYAERFRITSSGFRTSYDSLNYSTTTISSAGVYTQNLTASGTSQYNIQIGGTNIFRTSLSSNGFRGTYLGYRSGDSSPSGDSQTALGYGANRSGTGTDVISIGAAANYNGQNYNYSLFIGSSGSSSTGMQNTATNQAVIGMPAGNGYTQFYFGQGVSAVTGTPSGVTFNATPGTTQGGAFTIKGGQGSGTDKAGGDTTIAGGPATGAGVGGYIDFQTSDAGSSGTTLQTLTSKARLLANGNFGVAISTPLSTIDNGGSTGLKVTTFTSTTTAGASTTYVFTGSTGSQELDLPAGVLGRMYFIKNRASVSVDIDPNGSEEIYDIAALGAGVAFTINPGEAYILQWDGTYWIIM